MDIDVTALPEEHREWVQKVVEEADAQLMEGKELTAMAFMCTAMGRTIVAFAMDFLTDAEKNAAAHYLRQRCQIEQASAVLFVTEGWALPQGMLNDHNKIVARYGSIGESPHRIDSVVFQLETAAANYTCAPPLKPCPPSKKKRRIAGPVKFINCTSAGRFSQFLSNNTAKQKLH